MAVTLRDIAKRLNLSHATVSFVLNDRRDVTIPEITRQRVLEMAKEMGYRPNRAARALVSGKTNIIGVWIPTIRHRYYAEVLDAINMACRREGYETLFHRAYMEDGRRPFDWPIDGVIAVDVQECLETMSQNDPGAIVAAGAYVDRRFDSVEVDLKAGAYAMAAHLIESGGSKLVMLKPSDGSDGRDEGYQQALSEAGGEPRYIYTGRSEPTVIQEAVRTYVRRNGLPDGIFGTNDQVALAALRALADLGYYPPRDIVVGGFDGIHDAQVASLSTVVQPVEQLASKAVAMLLARIRNVDLPRQFEVLSPELVIRDTSDRTFRIATNGIAS